VGSYSINNSVFDVGLMFLVGVVGFLMRRFAFPLAPAIIGLILGPMAEQQLRRALAISQGDASVLFTRPLSATLLAISFLVIFLPPIVERVRARSAGRRA